MSLISDRRVLEPAESIISRSVSLIQRKYVICNQREMFFSKLTMEFLAVEVALDKCSFRVIQTYRGPEIARIYKEHWKQGFLHFRRFIEETWISWMR
ncbi:uncharacterized protein [Macrobrachium rosenbergii]|uniref:uncharacterized protein isoform X2 n=1 Tax=Macrobrachium rosenbergii TaxID=79674 RepID=UPI0034D5EE7D